MNKLNQLGYFFGLSSVLFLTACGGNGTNTSASDETGTLELAITDAEEDFLTYQIELDSIQLNREGGGSVELLPLSTEVDFVQYQELSELFAVRSIPTGTYSSATLKVDYSNANIVIQDASGNSFNASAVDSSGNVITELDIELNFEQGDSVVISPRKLSQLTLDLDLAASNTIESFEPAIVTVEPFMLAAAQIDENREHRVRGLLDSIDAETQVVSLNIRPMRLLSGAFGSFDFEVNDETVYEINEQELTGSEGFSAFLNLDQNTAIVAYGSSQESGNTTYLATNVYAGSSVPWSNQDVLKGQITSRSDNTITIQGAVIEEAGNAGHFKQQVDLLVGEDSIVTGYRLGDADISNLSIGQSILALGDFDDVNNQFDATNGTVRMKLNAITGEVAQASPLVLDLSRINKRPVELFDFSGTGLDQTQNADPERYEINTQSLDLSGIANDEWLQVRGYPTAFGSAPMDFDALSILNPDFDSHPARFISHWSTPEESNTITIENDVIALNLEDARSALHLKNIPGSRKLNLSLQTIEGNDEEGLYALNIRSEGVSMYRSYQEFINALQAALENHSVHQITANGQYNEGSQSLAASKITVRLAPNSETNEVIELETIVSDPENQLTASL